MVTQTVIMMLMMTIIITSGTRAIKSPTSYKSLAHH